MDPVDPDGRNILHLAVSNTEEFLRLFHESEDKNPKDIHGRTPLHEAASRGCEKICKIIIESVKDANPKDLEGSTPLHQAVINGHFDIYKLIREKAENKNPKDQRGRTPFHEAAIWGHFQIFTWIFERYKLCGFEGVCRVKLFRLH